MNAIHHPIRTAADVLAMLEQAPIPTDRRRGMISGVSRICAMSHCEPGRLNLDVPELRARIAAIRPAAHGVSPKTFANLRCLFAAALEFAGVIDSMGRGEAKRHASWAPLVEAIAGDKRRSSGLAAFMNWCACEGTPPDEVDDGSVQRFVQWLETRTLSPKPRDVARRVPQIWNEARQAVATWPRRELAPISFKAASPNLAWGDLPEAIRNESDTYLTLRAEPDLFDIGVNVPKRPLAASTIRQQREHIRLAVSVLIREGAPGSALQSLADLVEPEAFKTVLRHYYKSAGGEPNAFVTSLAKTVVDIARFHSKVSDEDLRKLKTIAAKLPAVPHDLTEKNKGLLRLLENERAQARLLFMPDQLMRQAEVELRNGRLPFVDAQVAIAADIVLVAPLRPQNLITLNWRRHFEEPQGRKGKLLLYIPKQETKSGKRELTFELGDDVARKIRWYRQEIMPRLNADPDGDLFVSNGGRRKSQATLTVQLIEAVAEHVGIHMTPHQFRHVAAALYLEEHPEDFQSVSDLLGHAWAKTTLIYAGSSSRRASRAYGGFILEQREKLRLKRGVRCRSG